MKGKKFRKKLIFLLIAIFLILLIDIARQDQGIIVPSIQRARRQDPVSVDQRFLKLREDLRIFEKGGRSAIQPDNSFYPIYETNFSAKDLEKGLVDTGLEGLGKDFRKAEKETGINALLLIAIANHESDYGRSNNAREKNNLFGFNAYDDSPFDSASKYRSYGDSIERVSKKLKDLYLSEDGRYYKGFSTEAMNHYYSTDPNWSRRVNSHMIRFAHKMLQNQNKLI